LKQRCEIGGNIGGSNIISSIIAYLFLQQVVYVRDRSCIIDQLAGVIRQVIHYILVRVDHLLRIFQLKKPFIFFLVSEKANENQTKPNLLETSLLFL
jgi:hypothetical protein